MNSHSSYPPAAAFLEEDLSPEDRDTLTDLEPFALSDTEES